MIEGRPCGRPSIELLLERHRVPVPRRAGRLPGRGAQRVTGWDSPGGPASRLSGQPPPGSQVDIRSVGPPPFSGAPIVPIRAGGEGHFRGSFTRFSHSRHRHMRTAPGERAPGPLHYRRSGAGPYRCRRRAEGGDGVSPRRRGGPARAVGHGRSGGTRHRGGPSPGGGGGHRHRKVPGLPGPGGPVGPVGRGRHRHPGAPGPARHEGPAPGGRRAQAAAHGALRRVEGPLELPVPPARHRGGRGRAGGTGGHGPVRRRGGRRRGGRGRRGRGRALRRRRDRRPGTPRRAAAPPHRLGRDLPHRRSRRARLRAQPPGLVGAVGVGPGVPRGLPLPLGHHLLRREGAANGPRPPTSWWSTPTCTPPTSPATEPSSPSTTWWSSTRPTPWRTS